MSKTQHFFTQDRKTCVATLDVVFIAMAVVVVVVVVVVIAVIVVVVKSSTSSTTSARRRIPAASDSIYGLQ